MTSFADVDPSFFVKDRSYTVVTFSKLGFGKNKIQFCQNRIILTDSVGVFGDAIGEFG